jgi:coproporphyrinogen III oxidase
MKKNTHLKKPAVPALHVDESMSLEEQVAKRAHELWHQRGYEHGADLADWFQAEREVHEWHQQRIRNSA